MKIEPQSTGYDGEVGVEVANDKGDELVFLEEPGAWAGDGDVELLVAFNDEKINVLVKKGSERQVLVIPADKPESLVVWLSGSGRDWKLVGELHDLEMSKRSATSLADSLQKKE